MTSHRADAVLEIDLASVASSGGGSAGAAGTDGLGAQAAPATSIAFFDVNIDRDSDGWKQLLALGARFPSWPKLVTQLNTTFATPTPATKVVARGLFNRASNTFTASSIDVVL